ncbi:MAG TPA: PA0069 family radical SAM protein [Planctomycetota bacterium]|nr:PA0069 family radical SAM protein [Planctomycetota bacterium]
MPRPRPPRGRGAAENPRNRFYARSIEPDPEELEAETPSPRTQVIPDKARSIIATNDSPDVGFDASINAYRGCEHGCAYCYARPFHEYLGFSAGLDFETKILVKEDAPELLRRELSSPKWKPRVLAMSGVTDCYQPLERRFELTRRCLRVLADFRNPVVIITKNHLVTRDIDLLRELAAHRAVVVCVSVTTLDRELARRLEPRTSMPARRLAAIAALAEAGIPVGVNVMPVIPGLTDHEIPAILNAAAEAGARFAGHTLLRLPHGVKDIFETWLRDHVPDRAEKVLHRVRETRGGKLYDSRYGSRMSGEGLYAEQIDGLFRLSRKKAGLSEDGPELSAAAFRVPPGPQLELF